jgi:hypothetical protein
MKTRLGIFSVLILTLPALLLCGCENYHESPEVNGLITTNDLSIGMKLEDNKGFTLEKVDDSEGGYYLKIDGTDEFSLRGQAPVTPGETYRLSFTMRNAGAGPIIATRLETAEDVPAPLHAAGRERNPPVSETQKPAMTGALSRNV